jgi:two-component system cell cycle sensor histidine kinase PleC
MVSANKLRHLVILLSLLVSVAVSVCFLVWAEHERTGAVGDAHGHALHSSQLASLVIDGNLGGIDRVLAGLELSFRVVGDNHAEMLALLRRQAPLIESARGLLLIAADGHTRYATNLSDPLARIDLSDRDYFRVHLETAGRTYVSAPLKSRNDGSWIIVVSRSMTGARGEFLGVAAATIAVESLATELKAALPAIDAAVLLVDNQGTILARSPDAAGMIGRSIGDLPAFRAALGQRRGIGMVDSPLDGRERYYGYTRSALFPLITVVSLDAQSVWWGWVEHVSFPGLMVLGLILLIWLLVARLLAQLRRMDQAQSQLSAARMAATAAADAKAAFVAHASHELRTPLTTIIGFADTLVHGLPGQECRPRCHEYLGHISAAGRHLQAVINDLLDLSRIEAGGLTIERVPVDLVTVIRETLRASRDLALRKDVELIDMGGESPVRVEGDNLRLRQLLLNLVSESLRSSLKGGRVEVALSVVGPDEARITVTDQGAGMTGRELQSVMSPLARPPLQASRLGEGTGLGLPLADQLAKLHGGRIEIVSRKGEGTTATVILPRGGLR